MTGAATTLGAALIGSAPGWAGVYAAFKAGQRHTDRQTAEIKNHVTDALAQKRDGEAIK